jgi:hypothetical protein
MKRKEVLIEEQNKLLKELVEGMEDIKAGRIKPLRE